MKILVCLKQVPHQDARLDIDGDGTWIKEDNIKFEINSYDTYALEEALRIKDAGEARGRGGLDRARARDAGAAHRARHGRGPRRPREGRRRSEGSDALGIARLLAAVAKAENPDLDLHGPDVRRRQLRGGAADARRARRRSRTRRRALKVERSNGTSRSTARSRAARSRWSSSRRPCLVAVQTRHQPGPLRVAQGHHGRQEEAARREDRRRSRRRGQGRRRRRAR